MCLHIRMNYFYRCLLGIFMIFVLISTAFHFHYIQNRRKTVTYTVEGARENHASDVKETLFSFSIINNVYKMFSIHPNELNLECISGIKFVSMTLIISSHSLLFLVGGPVLNTDFYDKVGIMMKGHRYTLIMNYFCRQLLKLRMEFFSTTR